MGTKNSPLTGSCPQVARKCNFRLNRRAGVEGCDRMSSLMAVLLSWLCESVDWWGEKHHCCVKIFRAASRFVFFYLFFEEPDCNFWSETCLLLMPLYSRWGRYRQSWADYIKPDVVCFDVICVLWRKKKRKTRKSKKLGKMFPLCSYTHTHPSQ